MCLSWPIKLSAQGSVGQPKQPKGVIHPGQRVFERMYSFGQHGGITGGCRRAGQSVRVCRAILARVGCGGTRPSVAAAFERSPFSGLVQGRSCEQQARPSRTFVGPSRAFRSNPSRTRRPARAPQGRTRCRSRRSPPNYLQSW